MKISPMRFPLIALLVITSTTLFAQFPPSKFIHYDQFGYLPTAEKVAVISDPITGFNAMDAYEPTGMYQIQTTDGTIVFEAAPVPWKNGEIHNASGDRGWWFNFSSVTTPGTYFIVDANSNHFAGPFEINENVYSDVLKAATKMFYYNRCNSPKIEPYAGADWTDEVDFMHAGQDSECKYLADPTNPDLFRDLSGGWWDAGDFNKYVTFAEPAVMNLLGAYEENPAAFGDDFNVPESGNGISDLIDEIKYETDWLRKMCNDDGSVHIKMGSTSFNDNVETPPSLNTDPRYYGPTCTSASLAIASMFSKAALIMKDIEGLEGYASILGTQAVKCFDYALPSIENGTLETDCDDGSINAGDADRDVEYQLENALTAAIYLFELTGVTTYHDYLNDHFSEATPIQNNFWGPYKMALQDALLHYTTLTNANATLSTTITNNITNVSSQNNNGFYGFNENDLYRSFMPEWSYHWGSNSPKANYSVLNQQLINHNINSSAHGEYEKQVLENIHYFHGMNPLGLVLLSKMYSLGAEKGINEIYHGWFKDGSVWDSSNESEFGPAPGYVTGGPNKDFSLASISPPSDNPPQKSYLDFNTGWPDNSWEISEPAIYYQAAYIRMLANATTHSTVSGIKNPTLRRAAMFSLYPNPASSNSNITLAFDQPNSGKIEMFNMAGASIQQFTIEGEKQVEISLPVEGTFVITFTEKDGRQYSKQVVVN